MSEEARFVSESGPGWAESEETCGPRGPIDSEAPTPYGSLLPDPNDGKRWELQNLKPWHNELLERMVLRPMDTLKDHARALGRHEVTVGLVARSDLFLSKLAELQGAREKLMVLRIDAKMDQTIDQGIDRIYEAVSDPECDPAFALSAVVSLDKRRRGEKGSGAHGPGAAVQVNIGISQEDLRNARAAIAANARGEIDGGNSDILLEALER